nr:hypothetical protein CoNPh38_CDS0265 [Staphylococcus phage S-CoN_Ph38]
MFHFFGCHISTCFLRWIPSMITKFGIRVYCQLINLFLR